jgi:Cu/Ag efflux pump CusA
MRMALDTGIGSNVARLLASVVFGGTMPQLLGTQMVLPVLYRIAKEDSPS